MKPKNFKTKLVLSKQTVSNLGNDDLKELKGGNLPPWPYTELPTHCPGCVTYAETCYQGCSQTCFVPC